MFRITHLIRLSNTTTRVLLANPRIPIAKHLGIQQHFLVKQIRFCSRDNKDPPGKKVDSCTKPKKITPKVILKECKPIPIHPCKPPKPDVPEPLPYINECPKSPAEQLDCPDVKKEREKECPYDEDSGWDSYKTAVWLGLFIAAGTLGMLYYLGYFDDKKKEEIVKVAKKKKKKRAVIKNPPNIKDIPQSVPYLLIGGGTASFAAFRAIKSAQPTAKVLVITNESFNPYMRPPLSKEMWNNDNEESVKSHVFKQWNGSERNLYYEPEDFYTNCRELLKAENGGVAVARGYTVTNIDVLEKIAYIDDYEIHYDKCLIATGSHPKCLSVFEVAACTNPAIDTRIKYFRNIFDFEDVYENFDQAKSIAIIGGSFLGSELACSLAKKGKGKGKQVHQIFRENGNMGKILPEYLSNWTTNHMKRQGVQVVPASEVIGVQFEDQKLKLTLSNKECISVDQVIVAVGVNANTELAQHSNLEVDPELGGFLVNTELQARTDLWVAGDCACFYDARLGRRRIEHHDHAVVTGRLAGENMTGAARPYLHQSMFWSDLGPDVGFEAIGIVDATLPTVGVFAKATDTDSPKALLTETGDGLRSEAEAEGTAEASEECKKSTKPSGSEDYGKGIVFYLRDDIVVGIVLWNVFNRMSIARQVLKDERKYDDLNEVAKLFNIHEE